MMSVILERKPETTFSNLAVGEVGYNTCLEICREADRIGNKDDVLVTRLKSVAMEIPLNLSKSASYKIGRKYTHHLRAAFISSKQVATLLMMCHDMNYIPSERFLTLNSKINNFSSRLWKYIQYCERKIKRNKKK